MNKSSVLSVCLLTAFVSFAADPPKKLAVPVQLAKPGAVTMAELAQLTTDGVAVREVSDYVFGKYQGDFPSPPHADLNAKKAFIIFWKNSPFRFVFAHEGSYCPWFELPSGSAVCYQFLEGNGGWAELFNNWGRQEPGYLVDDSAHFQQEII